MHHPFSNRKLDALFMRNGSGAEFHHGRNVFFCTKPIVLLRNHLLIVLYCTKSLTQLTFGVQRTLQTNIQVTTISHMLDGPTL